MRKVNQEITDLTEIENILQAEKIIHLAIHDDEYPYILPLNYAYHNNHILIHAANEGKKIALLKNNKKVSFVVERNAEIVPDKNACKWSTRYQSVMGKGKAEIITDESKKIKYLDALMSQHGHNEKPKYGESQLKAMCIIRIAITELSAKKSGNWDSVFERNQCNLETSRLHMQEISWADLDDIHKLHSIPEVDEFNTLGIPESIKETRKLITPLLNARFTLNRGSYTWKILEKDTNTFIGMAGMFLSLDRFKLGEIYYKFNPVYWGKGYATEVAKELIRIGFERFELQKVEAGVAVNNLNSIRVLEKIGMIKEGRRRKILPIRGKWVDNYHYAIVREEYFN